MGGPAWRLLLLAISLAACGEQQGGGNISGTVRLGASIQSHSLEGDKLIFPPRASRETIPPPLSWMPGEVLVKAPEGWPHRLPSRLRTGGLELRLIRALAVPGWALYGVSGLSPQALESLDMEALADRLEASPEVEVAHPNYLFQASKIPNDPLYQYQWHYPAINLPQAWDIEDGTSRRVVVAVIDSGALIRKRHPDLAPIWLQGYDFISDPRVAVDGDGRDPDPEDPVEASEDRGNLQGTGYHGAHVAGTIAASTNDGIGLAGVSWGAKVVPIRALGLGGGATADIVEGLLWAAGFEVPGVPPNRNPAQVINMSLGGKVPCTVASIYQDAIGQVNRQPQKPIIVVAAGNSQDDAANYSPASCRGVITVGATELRGFRAFYSNFGPRIDVMAPGGDVTVDLNGDGLPDGVLSAVWDNQRNTPWAEFYQGTSMAAPHVAGLVALMKARNPDLGLPEVLGILKQTARPLSDQACTGQPHPRVTVSLRSQDCGAGLVDARRALEAVSGPGPGPSPDFQLQLSPASLSLAPGQGGQVSIAILASGGFSGPVTLSLADAPPGVSGTFAPNPATATSTLSLSVGSGVRTGTYTLRVRGVSSNLQREALLSLSVTPTPPPPPPQATVAGTYVFALYIDREGNLDVDRSKAVQILRDGRSAPYTLRDLVQGTYLVAAWKDVNGNDDLDDADYLGVYVDRQGNYLVRPPRGGVDISLELMASLESFRGHGPFILQVIQKGLRETRRP